MKALLIHGPRDGEVLEIPDGDPPRFLTVWAHDVTWWNPGPAHRTTASYADTGREEHGRRIYIHERTSK